MSPNAKRDQAEHSLVDTPQAFADLCRDLARLDRFGFDAEFVAEEGYGVEACLIQIVTETSVHLVDPLAGFDIHPFWHLVSDPGIEKIVHAGLEDLAMCYHQTGQVPQNIFDVQLAAGLLGLDYPMSLLRLARSSVGARLHKSQTLTNWRKRPLTPEQMRYAVADVAHLLSIHSRQCDRLNKLDRMDWAREEFARFAREQTYHHEDHELFRRIKGAGSLDAKSLAILCELAAERDQLARRYDRPVRAVIKDHLMIAIARHELSTTESLETLRGLTLRHDAMARVASAVQRGIDTPPEQRPKPFAVEDDTRQEATLRKLVAAVLTDFCHASGVAVQLCWTNRDVRALVLAHTRADSPLEPGLLQVGWRERAVGDLLRDVLSGRRSIRVTHGAGGGTLGFE